MTRLKPLLLASAVAMVFTFSVRGHAATVKAEKNYDTYCVQCHGTKRNGTGLNVPALSVKPRDHTDAKGMRDLPDEEIFKAIKEGGLAVNKSVLMPAWGGVLSDREITDMVHYLREVCKCGQSH